MEIKKIVTGTLDENCYVLVKNGTCLVIDPGADYNKIREEVGNNKVLGVLITHSHFDHIGALRNFLTKRSIKIFKKSNLEEKDYSLGDFNFKCIYTPGHSKDSVSFFFEEGNAMFIGDFIFEGSIGRTDLPGGSQDDMNLSIKKILEQFKDVNLYPGHGDITTLAVEKKMNPYLQ